MWVIWGIVHFHNEDDGHHTWILFILSSAFITFHQLSYHFGSYIFKKHLLSSAQLVNLSTIPEKTSSRKRYINLHPLNTDTHHKIVYFLSPPLKAFFNWHVYILNVVICQGNTVIRIEFQRFDIYEDKPN